MADKEVKLTLKVDASGAIKETKTLTTGIKEVDKAQEKYTKSLTENAQTVRDVNKAGKALVKQKELERQVADTATGSYDNLSAQYRLNVIQLNAMGKAERETTEHGKKLESETLNIRTAMSDAKKATGDNTLEVGNYSSGVQDALAQSGLFGKLLAIQTKVQGAYAKAQAASTAATKGGTTATKALGFALKATGIGLIVAAVVLLVKAFASTQKGADKLNSILQPLKGAFESIKGIIQDLAMNVFGQLQARWTLAVEAIALGVAMIRLKWNQLTGDTEEAAEIMKEIEERTKAIADAQDKLNVLNKEGAEIWKTSLSRIKEGAETQQRIFELGIEIERLDIGTSKRKAEINVHLREQQTISKDISLSTEERLRATNETIKATEDLAAIDLALFDKRIEKMKLEQSFNDTSREEEKELSDLEAERINRSAQQSQQAMKFIARKLALEKKAITDITKAEDEAAKIKLESEEKELQRIESFEKVKMQLQQDLALEATESDEEREILKAEQDAEKKELELDQMILEAEERTELEALLLEQKENTLQGIRDKFGKKKLAEQEKLDKAELKSKEKSQKGIQSALNAGLAGLTAIFGKSKAVQVAGIIAEKAQAIASIGIATAKSWVKNTAQATAAAPPPLNVPLIAVATGQNIATGIMAGAQIATIAATTKFKDGGPIGGSLHVNGGTIIEAEQGEFISSRATMNNPQLSGIVQAANDAGNKGESLSMGISREEALELIKTGIESTPVFVLEQDITDTQRTVSVRESEFNG
jgi:hypothetical protein